MFTGLLLLIFMLSLNYSSTGPVTEKIETKDVINLVIESEQEISINGAKTPLANMELKLKELIGDKLPMVSIQAVGSLTMGTMSEVQKTLTSLKLNRISYKADFEEGFPIAKLINRNGFYISCSPYLTQQELDFIVKAFDNFFIEHERSN